MPDKSLQSAGAAGIWRADAVKIPFLNMFASTWGLLAGGLLCALPMLILRVKNHTEADDETLCVPSSSSLAFHFALLRRFFRSFSFVKVVLR